MRLDRLDLIAYGRFTKQSLDFSRGEQGLHLVCGENEAGKSTALEAIIDFLYGFPTRSTRDFLHAYRDLRIGATVRLRSGESRQLIRRKGNKGTLRDETDDQEVDEAWLTAALREIDRDAFQRQFGLGYKDLISGGEEVVRGQGDLAEILFATGAGLHHLKSARDRLREDADALYKKQAQIPSVNKAIRQLQELQREIATECLSVRDHHQMELDRDRFLREAKDLGNQITALQIGLHKRERLRSALQHATKRQHLRQCILELGTVPALDDGFANRRRDVQTELALAEQRLETARHHLEQYTKERGELVVPTDILDAAERIQELYEKVGAHDKALGDQHTLKHELARANDQLQQQLGSLGETTIPDDLEKLRPSDQDRRDVSKLSTQHLAIRQQLENARKEWESIRARRRELDAHPFQATPPIDTKPLKTALQQCGPVGQQTARYREVLAKYQAAEQAAQDAMKRITGWVGDQQDLRTTALPEDEFLDKVLHDIEQIESQQAQLRKQIDELEAQIDVWGIEARRLQEEEQIPVESQLQEARRQRDQSWTQWMRSLLDASLHGTYPTGPELIEFQSAFSATITKTDEMVDRMRLRAKDVATLSDRLHLQETGRQSLLRLRKDLAEVDAKHQSIHLEFSMRWKHLPLSEPPTPRTSRTWLTRAHAAITRAEAAQGIQVEAELAKSEVERAMQAISAAYLEMQSPLPPNLAASADQLDRWIVEANETVERLQSESQRWKDLQRQRLESDQAIASAKENLEKAEQQWNDWSAAWQVVVQRLCLPESITPEEVQRRLDGLSRIFEIATSRTDRLRRIRHIDENFADYREEVGQLARQLNASPSDDPRTTIRRLHSQLNEALAARKKSTELEQRIEAENENVERCSRERKHAESEIKRLCGEAGCKSPDELPEIERKSNERRKLEEQIRSTEDRLHELADGAVLEEFLIEVGEADADSLDVIIKESKDEIESLTHAQRDKRDQHLLLSDRLDQIELASKAADKTEELDATRARLIADVQRYSRLRLAESILSNAIERYRERNQDPVLQRASEYVRRLSLNSLSGLRHETDDQGRDVLMGLRPDGKTLPVEGMSEGLADQLYLALRLASMQGHLEKDLQIPLICDDLLIKFDDPRSRAALEILAEMSDRTQVIFFTHHQHLVEIARNTVPKDKLFVTELKAG